MDMVLHRDPRKVSSELLVDASIASHIRNAGCSGTVHEIRASSQSEFTKALLPLLLSGAVSEDFVLADATTIVTGKIDPSSFANKHGSWRGRSEKEVDIMVSTTRKLCEMNAVSLFDFETTYPCKINAQRAIETIMRMGSEPFMFRTAYFNLLGKAPHRVDDPLLPMWRHNHYPTSKVVTIGEVCMKSDQCKAWVRKIKHNEHTAVSA